mmetsp:Transcript_12203/g.23347  ORF Transcript_12203/g.23347 Transcript_12203/m.23347 type:complete len:207 (+) Transcript_12203:661-1281(+)
MGGPTMVKRRRHTGKCGREPVPMYAMVLAVISPSKSAAVMAHLRPPPPPPRHRALPPPRRRRLPPRRLHRLPPLQRRPPPPPPPPPRPIVTVVEEGIPILRDGDKSTIPSTESVILSWFIPSSSTMVPDSISMPAPRFRTTSPTWKPLLFVSETACWSSTTITSTWTDSSSLLKISPSPSVTSTSTPSRTAALRPARTSSSISITR